MEPHLVAIDASQAGQLAPRQQERLLDRVLGEVRVAQDADGDGEAPAAVEIDELAERDVIARPCSLDQRVSPDCLRSRRVPALREVSMVSRTNRFDFNQFGSGSHGRGDGGC